MTQISSSWLPSSERDVLCELILSPAQCMGIKGKQIQLELNCLLYTSDAADERLSVDLGGRRIIKKKFFQAEDGIRDIV